MSKHWTEEFRTETVSTVKELIDILNDLPEELKNKDVHGEIAIGNEEDDPDDLININCERIE